MTEDRGQKTESRHPSSVLRLPSSVSGAGGFFLLFLLLLINFLGGAMKTSLPLEPRPVRKVFVQDSGKMSPFQRLTLGIPISVNTDTALGLTAVPGIGPKTAAAIVRARERTGGFTQLNELLSIRGISVSLYHKISPYLTL
jgi:competence ComEA-like helix-hairpin-helix protein